MMLNKEWSAKAYAMGSYIQSTISHTYLPSLAIRPNDKVLDIGCGEGSFSRSILTHYPMASFLGIDASQNMLKLAKQTCETFPHAQFLELDIHEIQFKEQFNHILSFWCLQWIVDLEIAFNHIYDALTPGGQLFAIFPVGDDAFINTYLTIKQSGDFPELENFISPVDYKKFEHLGAIMNEITFSNHEVHKDYHSLTLPNLNVFKKFIQGVSFYDNQISDEKIPLLQDAMVHAFAKDCQKKHQGKLIFDFHCYRVEAKK